MSCLPVNPVTRVELCSLQQITKALKKNVVEEAWLMLLQPHSGIVTREAIAHSKAGGHADIQAPSRWDN